MVVLTDREKELYDILTNGKHTYDEISERMGLQTRDSVSDKIYALRKKGIKIMRERKGSNGFCKFWIDSNMDFEDKPLHIKKYEDSSDYGKELYDGVKRVAKTQVNKWLQEEPDFHFTDTIGILPLADFHLGHPTLDYEAAEEIFDMVKETDGLYTVLVGDMIDNSVNAYAPKGTTNIVDKDGQLAMMEYLLTKVEGKILVMYEGNHETRSFISDHFRITEYMSKGYKAQYGQYGGLFTIDMNGIEIKIYCRHKCKGNSQYNPLHPLIRAILFDYSDVCHDADILIRAHTHERACGCFRVGHKQRFMSVTGNMAIYDEFADRIGFSPRRWSYPMYIIKKDGSIRQYPRMKEGIEDLKLFREKES